MKSKIIVSLLSFGLFFSTLGASVQAAEGSGTEQNELSQDNTAQLTEVVDGNTTYYLNDQQEVIYAEVFEEKKLKEIKEFYPGTKIENADKNVKNIFHLDENGFITKSDQLKQETQKINIQHYYYPYTKYGDHEKSINFTYEISEDGYTKMGTEFENGSKQILSKYEYYPKTIFAERNSNIKYKFEFDKNGYLVKSNKVKQGTKQIVSRYEYYPKTTFDDRTKNIKSYFVLNSKGYITSSNVLQKGTGKTLTKHYYYDKAVYGKHSKKIKSTYNYDSSGYILSYLTKKDNSSILTSAKEYYPKTTTNNKAKNIKYTFTVNSSGIITKAYLKKKGSQKTLGHYTFKSGTEYGEHWSKVSDMGLYLPKIRQNPGLPWGCSVVALTEALNFKGYNLDKTKMAKNMPYSNDPYKGFVGSPFRSQQGDPNLIYPEGLVGYAKKYQSGSEVVNGISEERIKSELQKGNPVLVWVVWNFKVAKFRTYYSGEKSLYAPTEYHVIALSGYGNGKFYYVDTCGYAPVNTVSKSTFYKSFNSLKKRALIVK